MSNQFSTQEILNRAFDSTNNRLSVGGEVKEVYFICTTAGTAVALAGVHSVGQLNALNEVAIMEGFIPEGFNTLVDAVIAIRPRATQAAANFDLLMNYGTVGEDINNGSETDTSTTYNVTNVRIFEIDVSAILSSIAAGDYLGCRIVEGTTGHDADVLGLRIRYT